MPADESDGPRRVAFETPEDVEVAFELAGPGSRIAAGLVDALVLAAVILALLATLAGAGALAFQLRDLLDPEKLEAVQGFAVAVVIATTFGVNLLYFVACEWFLSGQTLGKRALGIRVVRDGGYAISVSSSIIRNVMRVVDMLPGPYFVGIAAIMISQERRRLGDFVAGTLVVREARSAAPRPRFAGERYSTLGERRFVLEREAIDRIGSEALLLLDGYFDRVERLDVEPARALTRTIASSLASRLGVALAPEDDDGARALLREAYLALRERLGA